jgi:hypothetical protein
MKDYQRLQHTVWECKYHTVFIPKYWHKASFLVSARELAIALRGVPFDFVPFMVVLALNFCQLFVIPDRVPVRLAIGFCPGLRLLPIKPVHGFGVFAIESIEPFLIPVSVVSILIMVVRSGGRGTSHRHITSTVVKPMGIWMGKITVRIIGRCPVRVVSGAPVRIMGGSSIGAIRGA